MGRGAWSSGEVGVSLGPQHLCSPLRAGPSKHHGPRLHEKTHRPPLARPHLYRPSPPPAQELEQVSSDQASAQTQSLCPGLGQWARSSGELGASLGPPHLSSRECNMQRSSPSCRVPRLATLLWEA